MVLLVFLVVEAQACVRVLSPRCRDSVVVGLAAEQHDGQDSRDV